MTTEPVRAFAIRLKDGTLLTVTSTSTVMLFTSEEKASAVAKYAPSYQGATVIPVLIVDDSPAARAVREAEQRSPCLWSNDGDMWEAPCGAVWMFEDGGPKENDMSFCHKCGHPLITTEDTDEDDDALLAARQAQEQQP